MFKWEFLIGLKLLDSVILQLLWLKSTDFNTFIGTLLLLIFFTGEVKTFPYIFANDEGLVSWIQHIKISDSIENIFLPCTIKLNNTIALRFTVLHFIPFQKETSFFIHFHLSHCPVSWLLASVMRWSGLKPPVEGFYRGLRFFQNNLDQQDEALAWSDRTQQFLHLLDFWWYLLCCRTGSKGLTVTVIARLLPYCDMDSVHRVLLSSSTSLQSFLSLHLSSQLFVQLSIFLWPSADSIWPVIPLSSPCFASF